MVSLAMAMANIGQVPSSPTLPYFKFSSQTATRKFRCIRRITSNEAMHITPQTHLQVPPISGNYQPCIWDYDFLLSFDTSYKKDISIQKNIDELKKRVIQLIEDEDSKLLTRLEFVDSISHLGLSSHFQKEIACFLETTSLAKTDSNKECGLYETALRFRIMRQYGFPVSQDVFDIYRDINGNFKQSLCNDIKGLLNLYEASYLGKQGEHKLDEARTFTTRHLQSICKSNTISDLLLVQEISHALELPRHWRVPRYETQWYIDLYTKKKEHVHDLLDLAKLDYNKTQVVHQRDLAQLTRWWKHLNLNSRLEFARDRLVESYLWGLGMASEQGNSECRISATKSIALITVIDDVYDVYGSLDEIRIFTKAVERWDVSASEKLPYHLKLCYLALYNFVNEEAYLILHKHGFDGLPYLKQVWLDLCNAYLQEAEISHARRNQTLEEYLKVAWVSVASCVVLFHGYMASDDSSISEGTLDYIAKNSNLLRWTSLIVRLTNDLATSEKEVKRGDINKSVETYMRETGASEDVARSYIWNYVGKTWESLNQDWIEDSRIPKSFMMLALNIARASHFIYQDGDGHGSPEGKHKELAMSLLVEPFDVIVKK